MFKHGIKAYDLITALQAQIDKHGNQEVYFGGQDYPEGVSGVHFDPKGDAYIPKDSFVIH